MYIEFYSDYSSRLLSTYMYTTLCTISIFLKVFFVTQSKQGKGNASKRRTREKTEEKNSRSLFLVYSQSQKIFKENLARMNKCTLK